MSIFQHNSHLTLFLERPNGGKGKTGSGIYQELVIKLTCRCAKKCKFQRAA